VRPEWSGQVVETEEASKAEFTHRAFLGGTVRSLLDGETAVRSWPMSQSRVWARLSTSLRERLTTSTPQSRRASACATTARGSSIAAAPNGYLHGRCEQLLVLAEAAGDGGIVYG
jgi:hypothetical protein